MILKADIHLDMISVSGNQHFCTLRKVLAYSCTHILQYIIVGTCHVPSRKPVTHIKGVHCVPAAIKWSFSCLFDMFPFMETKIGTMEKKVQGYNDLVTKEKAF